MTPVCIIAIKIGNSQVCCNALCLQTDLKWFVIFTFMGPALSLLPEVVAEVLLEAGVISFSGFNAELASGEFASLYALTDVGSAGLIVGAGTIVGGTTVGVILNAADEITSAALNTVTQAEIVENL